MEETCFYPITHWGYSDVGGVLDQNREKKQEQVIKNIISWLQATPEPYKRLDLLSQLQPLLKPPPWQPTPYLPSQLFLPILPVHTTHIPVCSMHVTVSLTAHSNSFTFNLAVLPPSVPLGFSGTAQIIAPIWESSFSVGPIHIHVSCWTPLDLASWSS